MSAPGSQSLARSRSCGSVDPTTVRAGERGPFRDRSRRRPTTTIWYWRDGSTSCTRRGRFWAHGE